MSTDDRAEALERELLAKPFDRGLRLEYADLLAEEDRHDEALIQYDVLLESKPDDVAALIARARCLLASGDRDDALDTYESARELEGFEVDDALEKLARHAARSSVGPRLVPSEGPRPEADVLAFAQPSEQRTTFADVAGMDDLKKTIRLTIIEPFLRPSLFARFKKSAGGGVLLYGPPGCGKTLAARATAGECRAEFISVGVSDILSRWIGESESTIKYVFEKARARKPCVLFFDELDALAYSRSKAVAEHSRTLVNEFLSQLDGIASDNRDVLILAASNMPWDVDPAMKRPGRFARQVFVPPLDEPARRDLLEMRVRDLPMEDIDLGKLARETDLFSGADIDGLVDLAKDSVLSDIVDKGEERPLRSTDFEWALSQSHASTIDWLRTARNLVRYGEVSGTYRELEKYLKKQKGFL